MLQNVSYFPPNNPPILVDKNKKTELNGLGFSIVETTARAARS